ncbi:monocarboxylate transporter 12-like [Oppia nitens]|uniref:monocarboxylate transporter 12-like n=1 Tax=Oppia nitens TaxID=1686743 RepID=UPI0023DCA73A|nr:monocarboxylate transporter 12-like [Oppia nitens]
MAVIQSNSGQRSSKCPDGGWGWVVVFASFMIHVIADGVTYTFGIFYYEILKHYKTSNAMTSWVASIMTGTTYCVGPIASALTNKYGCRAVTIAGAILSSVGFLLSLIAPDVITLYFTIGICTGFGFGLMYLPAIVSVSCYFEKKRAFATGIAVCGSGIGSAILAPLIEWLIVIYGWKGAMLIVSGLTLNCCVFGALFRPLEDNYEDNDDKCEENDVKRPLKDAVPKSISANEAFKMKPTLEINVTTSIEEEEEELDMCREKNDYLKNECISLANNLHEFVGEMRCPTRHSFSVNKVNESLINDNFNENGIQNATSMSSVHVYNTETSAAKNSERRRSCSLSPGVLYRKDIFYSGSLINIPHYKSNADLHQSSKKSSQTKQCLLFRCLHCSQEMIDTFNEMLDFTLLKTAIFLTFAISNFLTSIGFFVPHIYIKDRVVGLGIASPEESGFFISLIGIASTVGRLVFGYLSDHSFVNRLWLYSGSLTVCGIATMFSSLARSYNLMTIYCTIFGISCGTYVSLTSVILVDLLGIEKLTNAFGILLLFQGVASFIGPPIIGWLYDMSGSYDPGFYVAGCMIAMSGIMLYFIALVKYFKSLKKSFSL